MADPTRFIAGQLVDAVRRSARGGDPRIFLLVALIGLDSPDAEAAMLDALEVADLRADEWSLLSGVLAHRRPAEHLDRYLRQGLRSSSIGVQQDVVASLPEWAGSGVLEEEQVDLSVSWLRRRLRNPRRASDYALWEVSGVALTLAVTYGPETAYHELIDLVALMQPDERDEWEALPSLASDADGFLRGLTNWHGRHVDPEGPEVYADPTATRYVATVMKRLGIPPANPDVEVFTEDWER